MLSATWLLRGKSAGIVWRRSNQQVRGRYHQALSTTVGRCDACVMCKSASLSFAAVAIYATASGEGIAKVFLGIRMLFWSAIRRKSTIAEISAELLAILGDTRCLQREGVWQRCTLHCTRALAAACLHDLQTGEGRAPDMRSKWTRGSLFKPLKILASRVEIRSSDAKLPLTAG